MLVVIGSTNPVKIAATVAVLRRIYGAEVRVVAAEAPSGVPTQPWGDAETRQGALNRAAVALAQTKADFGVGLEGGLLRIDEEIYTSAWCAVRRADGTVGVAGGENLLLPPGVVRALEAGHELGVAVDMVSGEQNTKHKAGAIGTFTAGWLTRQTAYEHLLTLALARFLRAEYYEA